MNLFWWLTRKVNLAALRLITSPKYDKVMRRKTRAEIRKWLKFMIHLAQKDPSTPIREDYEHHWNYTSFVGKTILDLGADYGSTAHWFLKKGARRVVAVEGNPFWGFGLKAMFGKNGKVVCIRKFVDSPKDIEELIRFSKPDLVKVDIEGCEKHLLKVKPELLCSVPEWLIETHGSQLEFWLLRLFNSNGFNCTVCVHAPERDVFHAKK